jgi:hypothetical protein
MPNFQSIFNDSIFRRFVWKLEIGNWKFQRQGITLLLVVVLLSAILSIGVGIFNIVFGELMIATEITDSFRALYAADQGIERTLYRDRQKREKCMKIPPECFEELNVKVQSGGLYSVRVSKSGGATDIVVAGQSREGVRASLIVKRGFRVSY